MAYLSAGEGTSAEELLDQLASSRLQVGFRIPTHLRSREFGGLATFLQACATWARRFPQEELKTYVNRDARQLEEFCASDHGVVAALLAAKITDNAGVDITWRTRQLVQEQLARLQSVETARRGQKAMLVAADDTPWDSPAALYSTSGLNGGTVHSDAGFTLLAKQLLALGTRKNDLSSLLPLADQIGALLHEVLRNAHVYGRLEVDDVTKVHPSVRFLRAEGLFDSRPNLLKRAEHDAAMTRFLKSTSRSDRSRYLELTIWDSGPGLAARRMRDLRLTEPTIEQEWSASIDCFEKHMTTSSNGARGLGLDHVQALLTELHGFLRLRSGRVRLERDYVSHPHRDGMRSDFGLPTNLAMTRGTSFVLVIPTNPEDR